MKTVCTLLLAAAALQATAQAGTHGARKTTPKKVQAVAVQAEPRPSADVVYFIEPIVAKHSPVAEEMPFIQDLYQFDYDNPDSHVYSGEEIKRMPYLRTSDFVAAYLGDTHRRNGPNGHPGIGR